ncbi:hypothetical protein GC177_07605 [bacterium]|nr:hypothetical protein [bacterium]
MSGPFTLSQSLLDRNRGLSGGYRTRLDEAVAAAQNNPAKQAFITALLNAEPPIGVGLLDAMIHASIEADPFDAAAATRIITNRMGTDSPLIAQATTAMDATIAPEIETPEVADTTASTPTARPTESGEHIEASTSAAVVEENTPELPNTPLEAPTVPTYELAPATVEAATPAGQAELIGNIRDGFLYGKLEPARTGLSTLFDTVLAEHGGVITAENYQQIADEVAMRYFGVSTIEPGSQADAFRYDLEAAAAANLNIDSTATAFQSYMRQQLINRFGEDQVGKGGVLDSMLADVGMLTPGNLDEYLYTRSNVSGWIHKENAEQMLADAAVWVLSSGGPADVRAMVDQLIQNPEALQNLASNPIFAPMDEATLQALLTPNANGEYQDFYEHPLVQMLRNMPTGDRQRLIDAMQAQGIAFDPEVEQLLNLANYSADVIVYGSQFNEALARGPGPEFNEAVAGLNADIALSAHADYPGTPAGLSTAAAHGGMDPTAQAYDRVMQVLQTVNAAEIPALVEALSPAAREALLHNPDFLAQLQARHVTQEELPLLRQTLGLSETELAAGDSLAEVLARADYQDRVEDASLAFSHSDAAGKADTLTALLDIKAILADGSISQDEQTRLMGYAANPALADIYAMAFDANQHGDVTTYTIRADYYNGLQPIDVMDLVQADISRLDPASLAAILAHMEPAERTAFLADETVAAGLAAAGLDDDVTRILRDMNGGKFLDEQFSLIGQPQPVTEGEEPGINAQTATAIEHVYQAVMGQVSDVDPALARQELIERLQANPGLVDVMMISLGASERQQLITTLQTAGADAALVTSLTEEHAEQTAADWARGLDLTHETDFAQGLITGPGEHFGVADAAFYDAAVSRITASAGGLEGFMANLSPAQRDALLADPEFSAWLNLPDNAATKSALADADRQLDHDANAVALQNAMYAMPVNLTGVEAPYDRMDNRAELLTFLSTDAGRDYAAEAFANLDAQSFAAFTSGLTLEERRQYFGTDGSLTGSLPEAIRASTVQEVNEQTVDAWASAAGDEPGLMAVAMMSLNERDPNGIPQADYFAAMMDKIQLREGGIDRFMGTLDAANRRALMEDPQFVTWLNQPDNAVTKSALETTRAQYDNQDRAAWAEFVLTTGREPNGVNSLNMPRDIEGIVTWLTNASPEQQQALLDNLTAVDFVLIRDQLSPAQRETFETALGDRAIQAPATMEEAINSLLSTDNPGGALSLLQGQSVQDVISSINTNKDAVEQLEYTLTTSLPGMDGYTAAMNQLRDHPELAIGLAYNLSPAQFQLLMDRMPAADRQTVFGTDLGGFYSINQARAMGDDQMTVTEYMAELDRGSNGENLLDAIHNPDQYPVTLYGFDGTAFSSIDNKAEMLQFLAANGAQYGTLIAGHLSVADFDMLVGSAGNRDAALSPQQILDYFGPNGSLTAYLPADVQAHAVGVATDQATGIWLGGIGDTPVARAEAIIALNAAPNAGVPLNAYFSRIMNDIAAGENGVAGFMASLPADQRNQLLTDAEFSAWMDANPDVKTALVNADAHQDELDNGLRLIQGLGHMDADGHIAPAIYLEGISEPYTNITSREALLEFLAANPTYARAMLGQLTREDYEKLTNNLDLPTQNRYFGLGGSLTSYLPNGQDNNIQAAANEQIAGLQLDADGAMVRTAIMANGAISGENAGRFDLNGDGHLSVGELQEAVTQYGYDVDALLTGIEPATITGWAADDRAGLRALLQGSDMLTAVDGIYTEADRVALLTRVNDDASGLSASQIMDEIVRFSQAQPTPEAQQAMFNSLISGLDESFIGALSASTEGDLNAGWDAIVGQVPEAWRSGPAWDALVGNTSATIAERENTILHERAVQATFSVDVTFDADGTLPDDIEAYLAGSTTVNGQSVPNAYLVMSDADLMVDSNGDDIPDRFVDGAFGQMGSGDRINTLSELAEASQDATDPAVKAQIDEAIGRFSAEHVQAEMNELAMGVYQSLNGTDRAGDASFATVPVFSHEQAAEIIYALSTGAPPPAFALSAIASQFPVPPFHDTDNDGVADEIVTAWTQPAFAQQMLTVIGGNLNETGAYTLMMDGGLDWNQRTTLLNDRQGTLQTALDSHGLLDDLAKGDFHRFQNELLTEAWNPDGTSALDGTREWPVGSGQHMSMEQLVDQLLAGDVPQFLEDRYAPFGGLNGFGSAFVDEGAAGIEDDAADLLLHGIMFHTNPDRLITLFDKLSPTQIDQLLATSVTFDGTTYSVADRLREVMVDGRNLYDIAQDLKLTHNENAVAAAAEPPAAPPAETVTTPTPSVESPTVVQPAAETANPYVALAEYMNENDHPQYARAILTGETTNATTGEPIPEDIINQSAALRADINANVPNGLDYHRFVRDPQLTGLLNDSALNDLLQGELAYVQQNPDYANLATESLPSLSALIREAQTNRPDFDEGAIARAQAIVVEQGFEQLQSLMADGVLSAEELERYNALRNLPEIQAAFTLNGITMPEVSVPYSFNDTERDQIGAVADYYSQGRSSDDAGVIYANVISGQGDSGLIQQAANARNGGLFAELGARISQEPSQAYAFMTALPFEQHMILAQQDAFTASLSKEALENIVAGYGALVGRNDLTPVEQIGVASGFAQFVDALRHYPEPYAPGVNEAIETGRQAFIELSGEINNQAFLTSLSRDQLLQIEQSYRDVLYEGGMGGLAAQELFTTLDAYNNIVKAMENLDPPVDAATLAAAQERRDQLVADHLDMFVEVPNQDTLNRLISDAQNRGDTHLVAQLEDITPGPNTYVAWFSTTDGTQLYTFNDIMTYPSFSDYMIRIHAVDEQGNAALDRPDELTFNYNLDETRLNGMLADGSLNANELAAIMSDPELRRVLMDQLTLSEDVEQQIISGEYSTTLEFAQALINYHVVNQGDVDITNGTVSSVNMSGVERTNTEIGVNQ